MRLNDMINSVIQHNNTTVTSTGSVSQTQNANISAQIKALIPGQILQGEVLEHSGDAVKLLVHMNGENVSLQARMDQNIALAIGKNLLFQVKNNGSSLFLSPLMENMAMGETAAKALESANLPLNETTVNMTTTLMQEGMSISKESLQGIYQEVLTNQNAELMDIVDLHKLNLPVNKENLTQLHAYKEMTHQLSGGVEQMSRELMQLVSDMAQNGQGKDIPGMLQDMLQLPIGQDAMRDGGVQSIVFTENGTVAESVPQSLNGDLVAQTEELLKSLQESMGKTNDSTGQTVNNLSETDILNKLMKQLENVAGNKEALGKLVESDVFKNSITDFLQKQMMLEPEAAADKERVQDFFGKLSKQLGNISEALINAGQEQSAAAKTVQNMSQNVNFLNQMNQMYAYIQLPFKLSESNAHGELYVYSNKKHLASKDGEVSALLHLDMEHLGPVDVYVQMKDANVSTRFYLKDDEMLDFIEEHIDILNARLEKRGYHMNCSMTVRDTGEANEENVTLQELLKENSNIPTLVNYSFDVRA